MAAEECSNLISNISDIFVAASAVSTVIIAWCGLNKWRDEHYGKIKFNAAQNMLKATYAMRGNIEYLRSPFLMVEPHDPNNKDERVKAHGAAYDKKFKNIASDLENFDVCALEIEVLFGKEESEKLTLLRNHLFTVRHAIQTYLDNIRDDGETFKENPDFAKMIKSQMYNIHTEKNPNELTLKIQKDIKEIEDFLKPHLGQK